MGELINLNPAKPIVDADIPAAIARDAEYIAADDAHVSAADPHAQYLLQSEGDARYRRSGVTQYFEGGVREVAPYASCYSSRAMATGWYGNNDTLNRFSFGLHIQSYPWADAAYMCFHRPGSMITFFGLDTDNQLKWGGGTSSPQRVWHEGYGTPVWQSPSDRALKQNIRPLPSALALILEAQPVSFRYNQVIRNKKDFFADNFQRDKIHYGFLANDFPIQDLVSEKDTGFLGLDYLETIPFVFRAIQELYEQITTLKKQIELLKV